MMETARTETTGLVQQFVERTGQLQSPPADIRMVGRIQCDHRPGGHAGPRLGRGLAVDSHLSGQDQRPRPLARGRQATFDEHRVEPIPFLQCVRATTHRAIAGS